MITWLSEKIRSKLPYKAVVLNIRALTHSSQGRQNLNMIIIWVPELFFIFWGVASHQRQQAVIFILWRLAGDPHKIIKYNLASQIALQNGIWQSKVSLNDLNVCCTLPVEKHKAKAQVDNYFLVCGPHWSVNCVLRA